MKIFSNFLPLLFIHESFSTTKSCNNDIVKIQDTEVLLFYIKKIFFCLVRSLNIQMLVNSVKDYVCDILTCRPPVVILRYKI